MSSNNFKVIIVGGGPVGLTSAHALSRAGIDFVILEGREDATPIGGSHLVMNSLGWRALSELGLSDVVKQVTTDLPKIKRINDQGRDIGDSLFFEFHKRDFGMYPSVISRYDLTRILYDSLPAEAQAKILLKKRVFDIKLVADGVQVTCRDGSVFSGSMVVGADGAHSVVRDQMRNLALAAGSEEVNAEKPFLTTYRCLWMSYPRTISDKLYPGLAHETHTHGASTQLFAGEETCVAALYERLDQPTRDRIRFTQADTDAALAKFGSLPLLEGGSFTLADAWAGKIQSGMVSLEEGVVDHWSHDGRIVLVGDAAHKFTPITGAGCNNGIVDVIVLANEIHKAFEASSSSSPSQSELSVAFKAYQEARFGKVKGQCAFASRVSATSSWANFASKMVDNYVLSNKFVQRKLWGTRDSAEDPSFYFANQSDDKIAATAA
ncbi:FAD/NAD(P)-binding domain-containing protein [Xylariaceae sp. FL0255]|nr:FAD/NAD(P)-binding domain-containing protein [Xylariaceae sp. FL0255]